MQTAQETRYDILVRLESLRAPLAEVLGLLAEISDTPWPAEVPESALKSVRESADAVREAKANVVDARLAVTSAQADLDRLAGQSAVDVVMQAAADRVQTAERDVKITESRCRAAFVAQNRAAAAAKQAANSKRAADHARASMLLAELTKDPVNQDGTIGRLLRDIGHQRDAIAHWAVNFTIGNTMFAEFVRDAIEAEMEPPLPTTNAGAM